MKPVSQPTLLITPVRAAFGLDQNAPLDFVVRIQTPQVKKAAGPRPTLNLALVIDASGSMLGKPLADAHQATLSIVDRLADNDRVAVMVYDDHVETVLESMPVAQARSLLQARLARSHSGGSTALHAGWLAGAQAVAPFVSEYGITRVILLSDGDANAGERNADVLASEAARLAEAGVGTSTYGLGMRFNEQLMTALAKDGLACFAESAEDLAPYFESEFTMLADTVGRRVEVSLSVRTEDGRVLTLDNLNERGVSGKGWALTNLVSGAETWSAFAVDPKDVAAGSALILDATVGWLDTQGVRHEQVASLTVPVKAKAPKKEDAWAAERVREVRAARLQREAIAKARRGDFDGARTSVNLMRGMAMNNAYVSGVSETLSNMLDAGNQAGFLKEATYAAASMSSRVTATSEDAALLSADAYGLRKLSQGQSSASSSTPSA